MLLIRTSSVIGTDIFRIGTPLFGLARVYCITLNQMPLVLVDVLKENINPLFKHIIRISISYIWKINSKS